MATFEEHLAEFNIRRTREGEGKSVRGDARIYTSDETIRIVDGTNRDCHRVMDVDEEKFLDYWRGWFQQAAARRDEINPGDDLIRAATIARMLGVSRQYVTTLAERPEFPEPEAMGDGGWLWRRSEIERWASEREAR